MLPFHQTEFDCCFFLGETVILKDASAWELLNIPVDEAIDIFDHLLQDIQDSGE